MYNIVDIGIIKYCKYVIVKYCKYFNYNYILIENIYNCKKVNVNSM